MRQPWIAISFLLVGSVLAQDGAFKNKTHKSGIQASYGSGNDSFLAGGAVGDFDRDGWQDVFYPAGAGGPDLLYINNGDGSFSEVGAQWGVDLVHRSTAASVADYDGDGWLDIYVTSLGTGSGQVGKHVLYHNNGDQTFTDVAVAAGVNQTSMSTPDGWGAAWGDYDLDGDLDLAVAGWRSNDGNRLFENLGNGTFVDATASAGLAAGLAGISGFAPRFVDMDGDRFPELVWVGDFSTSRYFVNQGDGTFKNHTSQSGTSQDSTEMGTTIADWDEDGDFDIYVTTISTNNLYINQGSHTFINQAASAGVVNTQWGWGTVAIDFNLDSYVDIVATTQSGRQYAFVNRMPTAGFLKFDEVALSIGLVNNSNGRGLANFDYDNDGDQDLIFFPRTGIVKLFRNNVSGPNAHYLRVFLDRADSTTIAPDGIGSVVEIDLGGRTLMRRVDGGSNYLSQSELSANFGLGSATRVDELRVLWSDGTVTVLKDVTANQTLTIRPNGSSGYCVGGENSTGFSGKLVADGSLVIGQDDFTLSASLLPASQPGVFFFGFGDAQIPLGGGILCVGGGLARLPGAVTSDASGMAAKQVDFSAPPAAGSIAAGSTVRFQFWYRDGANAPNLTNGVLATFR